jgi:ribosome-associated protein
MATDRRPKGGPRVRAASPRSRKATVTDRRTPVRKATKARPAATKVKAAPKRAKAAKPAKVPDDVKAAIAAALDKKAEQVHLLDLRKGSAFTDFFIIATGTNIRQVQAIADGIEESLKKMGVRPSLVEGYARAEWILLDYFDFIVHVFTPATREFYALERLWGDAESVEVSA